MEVAAAGAKTTCTGVEAGAKYNRAAGPSGRQMAMASAGLAPYPLPR
jgi:hypothetical protein